MSNRFFALLFCTVLLGAGAFADHRLPTASQPLPTIALAVAKDPAPPAPPAPTPTAPYVKLPETKKAKPNRYFCLKPDTNCSSIRWVIPEGLDKIDPEIQLKDKLVAVLVGDTGTYVVQAYGALGDQASDIASCTVTIGSPAPPTPPTPPTPTDPLTAVLQSAYNQDADKDRATSLAYLQNIYAGLASQSQTWADVKTNADALNKIKTAVEAPNVGLSITQLTHLRHAIATEMVAKFGTTANASIDLTALATELGKITTALKGVQ